MTEDQKDPPRDPQRPSPLPFNSPSRARLLSGDPTWGRSGETYAVIPDLGVRPLREIGEEWIWQIRAWGANGVMFRAEVKESSILEILQCWREDPEGTWEKLFGGKPPGIAGGISASQKTPSPPRSPPRKFTEEELDDLDF